MADNSTRKDATGNTETIASDDIAGIKHQRFKLRVGADGAGVDVEPPDADGKGSTMQVPAAGLVWNGASWDRARSAANDAMAATGIAAVSPMIVDDAAGVFKRPRAASADGAAGGVLPGYSGMLYNGATHDRERGNTGGEILASQARTSTTTTAAQTNHNARGVIIVINVTVAVGGENLTLWLIGGTGQNIYLASSGQITTVAKHGLEVYPGATGAVPGGTHSLTTRISAALPRTWLVEVRHSAGGGSWTYSLYYNLIV